MKYLEVLSVNISEEKGEIKKAVDKIVLNDKGIVNDAHAGDWHRQISLLGVESVEVFEKQAGRKIRFGEFAENITTKGITLYKTKPGDRFVNDDIDIVVTQIGKKCHGDDCAIFREVGNCIMPKEGIFTQVIKGGELKAGDRLLYVPGKLKIHVITLSDRASKGVYDDLSGPEIKRNIQEHFKKLNWEVEIMDTLIADNAKDLEKLIAKDIENSTDIVITTGGTGIGKRDITPETVMPFIDKDLSVIMDYVKLKYADKNPSTLLSRGVAGVCKNTLIFALPGSLKAVKEYMFEIDKNLEHLIYAKRGVDLH